MNLRGAEWLNVSRSARGDLVSTFGGEPRPIHIWGDPGRGKSYMAAAVSLRWRGKVEWWSAAMLTEAFLACRMADEGYVVRTYADGEEFSFHPHSIQSRLSAASLVVLDDIGIRTASEAAIEVFFGIVEARAGKWTIFTGNNKPSALPGLYDGRIASRINGGLQLHVTGADRRLAQAERVEA